MSYTEGLQVSDLVNVNNSVDRHGTTALGAIEGKEPALATSSAVHDAESPRVEHTQGGIFLFLYKCAFLCV